MAVIADKEEGANQLCSAFENTSYHEKMMKYIDTEHQNENDVVSTYSQLIILNGGKFHRKSGIG